MEPVLFYGVPQGCSFGSIVALEWLGQPYRLCRIEMLEHPWHPLYARVNPLFQTPALLLEDGEPLTESLAILQHIASRDPSGRLGFAQGARQLDRLNEMLAFLNTDFFSAFSPLWAAYEAKTLSDAEKSFLRSLGTRNVRKACAHLDGLLHGRSWLLGGDSPTVADAYLAGVGRWVEYLRVLDIEREYPNLAKHLRKLGEDPAVRFARAIESGDSPPASAGFRGHVTLDELRPRLAA